MDTLTFLESIMINGFWFTIINQIKKLFGQKYEIDSKPYRKALAQYPYTFQCSSEYLMAITKVKAFQKKNKIYLKITTHRPGILVGRKGELIAGITQFIQSKYKLEQIKIEIFEEKIFQNLYE